MAIQIKTSRKNNELRKGDIGTRFEVLVYEEDPDTKKEVPVPLNLATVKKLKFEMPNGTTKEEDLLNVTDGLDGRLYWTTLLITDLDQEGDWIAQAYIEIPGWKGHSDQESFSVGRVIVIIP